MAVVVVVACLFIGIGEGAISNEASATPVASPLSQSFDASTAIPPGWTATGLWRVGSDCSGASSAPHSLQFNSASTCDYNPLRSSGLATSPAFDISTASAPTVTFSTKYQVDSYSGHTDQMKVQAKLIVAGTPAGSAQIDTTVKNPLDVGLVVMADDGKLAARASLVPFGHLDPGTHILHWDLTVNGQPLRSGRYLVALEIFRADGVPSGRPFPPPALLTISPDGRASATMTNVATTRHDELGNRGHRLHRGLVVTAAAALIAVAIRRHQSLAVSSS